MKSEVKEIEKCYILNVSPRCKYERATNTIANSYAIDWKDDCEENCSLEETSWADEKVKFERL